MSQKIKKNDKVKVMVGRDKGKEAVVTKIYPDERTILLENINMVKKHNKPTREHQGAIVSRAMPMDISKVMLVCPACSKPTRVGFTALKDAKKVRVCRKCGENIDK